ncbi:MAG TPA: hypothetical protein VF609_01120, partial [Flavisolibacter sp.]
NVAWIEAVIQMTEKWGDKLPAFTDTLRKSELKKIEFTSRYYFLKDAIRNKTGLRILLPHYLELVKTRPLSLNNLRIIGTYLHN